MTAGKLLDGGDAEVGVLFACVFQSFVGARRNHFAADAAHRKEDR